MHWKKEWRYLLWITMVFILAYFLPVGDKRFIQAIHESLHLARWYAREHVILCLLPAFFIAGVISVFISQASILKYFGANARKWLSYLIASVSGTILAVCSCTILPLFSSIYKRGAGLGPAVTFLYSGPAINILAIILTARILGPELGFARFAGAVIFSIVIGVIMHAIYHREEREKSKVLSVEQSEETRPLWQTAAHFFVLVAILIFANWGRPAGDAGLWHLIWSGKWWITGFFGLLFGFSLITIIQLAWYKVFLAAIPVIAIALLLPHNPMVPFLVGIITTTVLLSQGKGEASEWMSATWDFAKQILPLLAAGVLIAGFLLGSPEGGTGIIPERWIITLVGGNSVFSNFFASIVGAFMYFATLTEVPILQGLIANGMGKGPALALLLAGPALSLPNMLVIRSVIGTRKTLVFIALVVVMATVSGILFGALL
jgi:uncharacterized membrane protein YraQ (UPF0718 family)